jgi:hypothetical protein
VTLLRRSKIPEATAHRPVGLRMKRDQINGCIKVSCAVRYAPHLVSLEAAHNRSGWTFVHFDKNNRTKTDHNAVPIIRMSSTNMTNIYRCREEYSNKTGIIFIPAKGRGYGSKSNLDGRDHVWNGQHSSQVVLSN